ncbi:MAG: cyclic nucleotide-binding domain-containing protein [Myxococcota bacterium]
MEWVTSAASADDLVRWIPSLGLLAAADAGDGRPDAIVGARMALDTVRTQLEQNRDHLGRFRRHPTPAQRAEVLERLRDAFQRAAQELYAFARRREGVRVTLDAVLFVGHEAFVGHLGEGRVFLVRRGVVHQLTVDHVGGEALVGEAVRKARALGGEPTVAIESLCMETADDDRFVICSAPLVRAVAEADLHARLVAEPLDRLPERLLAGAGAVACAQLGSGSPFTADLARARLAVLAPMQLFAHCTERELRIVAQATHPRRLPADAVVFEEGQAGNELYLLISGAVDVVKRGRAIARLPPGSVFGEMALLDEPVRSATARTAEPTELMVITRRPSSRCAPTRRWR